MAEALDEGTEVLPPEGLEPLRRSFATVAARAKVVERRKHRAHDLGLGTATDHRVADRVPIRVHDDETTGFEAVLDDDEPRQDLPRHDVAVAVHHVDTVADGAEGVEHAVRPPPEHREDRIPDHVEPGRPLGIGGWRHLRIALELLAELPFRKLVTKDALVRNGDAEKGEDEQRDEIHVFTGGTSIDRTLYNSIFPHKKQRYG